MVRQAGTVVAHLDHGLVGTHLDHGRLADLLDRVHCVVDQLLEHDGWPVVAPVTDLGRQAPLGREVECAGGEEGLTLQEAAHGIASRLAPGAVPEKGCWYELNEGYELSHV